jgi:hypothetical protein
MFTTNRFEAERKHCCPYGILPFTEALLLLPILLLFLFKKFRLSLKSFFRLRIVAI